MIFRANYNQITAPGGLWDTSYQIYSKIPGAIPCKTPKFHWTFPSGATVNFAHIARDEDVHSWQGSQLAMEGYDELTHFTKSEFFYMMSRNRSVCGIQPYIRCTCNPDADSWVAEFISWWIDQDTGYPIPERGGKIRWMVNLNDSINWFGTKTEAMQFARDNGATEDELPYTAKSVTFIPSTLFDNKILMETNPSYLASLRNLTYVDQERLLKGNWKIKQAAGNMFRRAQAKMVDEKSFDRRNVESYVRGWDLAATAEDEAGDPCFTASVLVASHNDGSRTILDVTNDRLGAGDVEKMIINTAIADRAKYGYVRTRLPEDPGAGGKTSAYYFTTALAQRGFDGVARLESGSKVNRATPVAAMWQHGLVNVMAAEWNEMYFQQLEGFPDRKFKDMVDATSSAFDELANYMTYNINNLI